MQNLVSYADVRNEISDADLLLFRSRDWYTRLIGVGGRSQYVHAAMAGWWKKRLMCVEMTSGGGRAQLLSNIVERWPGKCDVFQTNALRRRFSRHRAMAAMIAITGVPYGKWNLFRTALVHLAGVRLFVPPDEDDAETTPYPPFCSQAVSMACRRGGFDPVPELADRVTEPGDLRGVRFSSTDSR